MRPDWSSIECVKFLEKYHDPIYSSLTRFGRELLENFTALEDIEKGAH